MFINRHNFKTNGHFGVRLHSFVCDIMARRVNVAVRRLIVRHHHAGRSLRDIASLVDVHKSTVSRILKRYRRTGLFAAGVSSGRPRCTNARDDRVLMRLMDEDCRASTKSLARSWSDHLNRRISRRTTNHRLISQGFRARRLIRVPFLSQRNRICRLEWARQHSKLTIQHWRHVIFTDESRVTLDSCDGRQRM